MNVNIQRLCRARTSLPFLVKRYAATVAASDPPAPKLKKEFDPQGISSKFGIRPEIARRQFPKHIDKWLGSDIPTIFKHLVDNYQVDGHLSQQTPGSEVNGLPGWGESGIDLKFRMFRTVEICHL
jgi:hypothetical protein